MSSLGHARRTLVARALNPESCSRRMIMPTCTSGLLPPSNRLYWLAHCTHSNHVSHIHCAMLPDRTGWSAECVHVPAPTRCQKVLAALARSPERGPTWPSSSGIRRGGGRSGWFEPQLDRTMPVHPCSSGSTRLFRWEHRTWAVRHPAGPGNFVHSSTPSVAQ